MRPIPKYLEFIGESIEVSDVIENWVWMNVYEPYVNHGNTSVAPVIKKLQFTPEGREVTSISQRALTELFPSGEVLIFRGSGKVLFSEQSGWSTDPLVASEYASEKLSTNGEFDPTEDAEIGAATVPVQDVLWYEALFGAPDGQYEVILSRTDRIKRLGVYGSDKLKDHLANYQGSDIFEVLVKNVLKEIPVRWNPGVRTMRAHESKAIPKYLEFLSEAGEHRVYVNHRVYGKETVGEFLKRHKLEPVNGKYVLYHGRPKGSEYTTLRVGSYLIDTEEEARFYAARDRRINGRPMNPKKDIEVLKLHLNASDIEPGVFLSLRNEIEITPDMIGEE
jgi:hypothetical protein